MAVETYRNLWTGFTQFIILNEKPPDRYTWSGERLTKKQTTSRPDHLWPEIRSRMSEAVPTKGKAAMGHGKTEVRQCAKVD